MMKSIRSRLTVTFIGLIAVILAVIWGVNKWYLEDFYVTKKVQALNGAYEAIDSRIEENKENGISIGDASIFPHSASIRSTIKNGRALSGR